MLTYLLSSDMWGRFVNLTPLHVLLAISVGALLVFLFTRLREALVIAVATALYAVPLLLT